MGQLAIQSIVNTSVEMFDIMDKALKFAQVMAKSDIIPLHYRGKTENVFVAIQTAYRMNLDPMLVMQNTFIINGKLGMNSSFAIALANNSGLFAGGIRYKVTGSGDDLRVTAYTFLKKNNEEISYSIGMKEARAENWVKNPKYRSLPELMLRYRAATLLIRTHAPEVLNGMHMVDEIEDAQATKTIIPINKAQSLTAKLDNVLDDTSQEEPVSDRDKLSRLQGLIVTHEVSSDIIEKWCQAAKVDNLKELPEDKVNSCIDYIIKKAQTKDSVEHNIEV